MMMMMMMTKHVPGKYFTAESERTPFPGTARLHIDTELAINVVSNVLNTQLLRVDPYGHGSTLAHRQNAFVKVCVVLNSRPYQFF
jgi:hypothetical protein